MTLDKEKKLEELVLVSGDTKFDEMFNSFGYKEKIKLLKNILSSLKVDLECEQEKFSNSEDKAIIENITKIRADYIEINGYFLEIKKLEKESKMQLKREKAKRVKSKVKNFFKM